MEPNQTNQSSTQSSQNGETVSNEAPKNPQPSSNTGMALLCYLGILIIIPFLTDSKNDPFVKFHIKQGLVLLVLFFAATMIAAIPILGWIVSFVAWVLGTILAVLGIINALSGKQKELPLIGKYASHFNF
jgi:uncharacterized membrane protein